MARMGNIPIREVLFKMFPAPPLRALAREQWAVVTFPRASLFARMAPGPPRSL